jgi:hypothetical protein
MNVYEPHRKHLLRHRFCSCVRVVLSLPRNESTLFLVAYLLRTCLPSRSLAMDLYVTISSFCPIYVGEIKCSINILRLSAVYWLAPNFLRFLLSLRVTKSRIQGNAQCNENLFRYMTFIRNGTQRYAVADRCFTNIILEAFVRELFRLQ